MQLNFCESVIKDKQLLSLTHHFSLSVESNFRPVFIFVPHLHENSYLERTFYHLFCIKNAVEENFSVQAIKDYKINSK